MLNLPAEWIVEFDAASHVTAQNVNANGLEMGCKTLFQWRKRWYGTARPAPRITSCWMSMFNSSWYFLAAYKHYIGPQSNLNDGSVDKITQDAGASPDEKKTHA